jgi:hypothetical protein
MQEKKVTPDTFRLKVRELIKEIDSPQKVYDLFRELNYPRDKIFNPSYKRRIEEFDFSKKGREKIREIYTVFRYDGDLNIYFVETKSLSNHLIEYVTKVFSRRYNMFLLVLTIDFSEIVFVFPDIRVDCGRVTVGITRLPIKKDEIHCTDIDVIANLRLTGLEEHRMEIFRVWENSFSAERI